MSVAFECAMCKAYCRLVTEDDQADLPYSCPWSGDVGVPKWQEAAE